MSKCFTIGTFIHSHPQVVESVVVVQEVLEWGVETILRNTHTNWQSTGSYLGVRCLGRGRFGTLSTRTGTQINSLPVRGQPNVPSEPGLSRTNAIKGTNQKQEMKSRKEPYKDDKPSDKYSSEKYLSLPSFPYLLYVYILSKWDHSSGFHLWFPRSSLGSRSTPGPPYSFSRVPQRH